MTDTDTALWDRYYTAQKTERQSYDLVIPAGLEGSAGLVLCIHGGGWTEGSKDFYRQNLLQMAARGFAAAAVNYRYASRELGFDGLLDDVTAALSAIKAEGLRQGVAFDRALLNGVSAGGHLSLLYAYTKQDVSPIRPVCVVELCGPADLEDPAYYAEENRYRAYLCRVIGLGTGTDLTQGAVAGALPALKKYSPVNHIGPGTVPTLFGHGENDEIVPYQNALDLEKKLAENRVEHTFVSFPASGHECGDRASMHRFMELFFACAEKYL